MSCCEETKSITIYKGFGTHFMGQPLFSLTFNSDVSLEGYKAYFFIGDIVKEYDDITQEVQVDLTKEETSTLPEGLNYGSITVEDLSGHKHPFTTAIPFFVSVWEEGDIELSGYSATITTDIQQNTITINVETGGGSGTFNHDELIHRDYDDQHPISAITGLRGELDDISQAISNETDTRQQADEELAESIENEAQARANADIALGNRISAEEQARTLADTALGTRIDNEVSTRQTDVNNLNTALQTEITNRTNADNDLAQDIRDEETRATTEESNLNTLIEAEESERISSDEALQLAIGVINGKIPAQATSSNQLADKEFVNSSIATNTANFIGTFDSLEELEAYTGTKTNNDYAFVIGQDSEGNTEYKRYKWTTAETPNSWKYEFTLNNSSFTAEQWAAISSKITASKVEAYDEHIADTDIHVTTTDKANWNGKQNALVSGTNIKTINNKSVLGSGNLSISEITSAERTKLGSLNAVYTYNETETAVNLSSLDKGNIYYGNITIDGESYTGLCCNNKNGDSQNISLTTTPCVLEVEIITKGFFGIYNPDTDTNIYEFRTKKTVSIKQFIYINSGVQKICITSYGNDEDTSLFCMKSLKIKNLSSIKDYSNNTNKNNILDAQKMLNIASSLYGDIAESLKTSDVVDDTTSTETNKPLSANMGKKLADNLSQEAEYRTQAYTALEEMIDDNTTAIETINTKIPSEATSSNQLADKSYVDNHHDTSKQDSLVSGTNIKTINNTSILGSGNISVATSAQGAKADTALQPNDDISKLNNNAGYQTEQQVNTAISNHNQDEESHSDIRADIDELDERIDEIQLFKFPNAIIRGEPTIQNGQISDFSVVSYLQFPFLIDFQDNAFQIDFCFTTATNVQTQQNILDSNFGIALAIANGKGLMAISSNGTSWNIGSSVGTINIQPNTTYYARLLWNKLQYKTLLSTDGQTYTQDMVLVGATRPYPRTTFIGGCNQEETGHTPHPFLGTINMNKSFLYVNNQLIWQGMDDAGLATRADISLSNLDADGEARFTAKQDVIDDLDDIRSGAEAGSTALQSISSSDVTTALGYIPANNTDLTTHTGNGTIHVTANDKIAWSNKLNNPSGGTVGQYLQKTTDGVQWSAVDALPSQSGQSGKFLKTNGTTASWDTVVSTTITYWE